MHTTSSINKLSMRNSESDADDDATALGEGDASVTNPKTNGYERTDSANPKTNRYARTDSAVANNPIKRDFGVVVQDADDDAPVDDAIIFAEGEERITKFVVLLLVVVSMGGLLFGIDTGVIGGVLVHKDLASGLGHVPLSNFDKELITSATTLGALIGGILAGVSADIVGRKAVLFFADIVFILGAVMQSVSYGSGAFWIMVVGRFVLGWGVGLASLIVPLLIGELSPTAHRGRLVTLNVVAITFGQVVAYLLNLAFQNVNEGWRYMVGLCAVPPVAQMCLIHFVPESPRYLLRKNRSDETLAIMRKIYPLATDDQIKAKVEVISTAVQQSMDLDRNFALKLRSLFCVPASLRALVIACGLQIIQQLSGFNTITYYSPTLFGSIGFRNSLAIGLVTASTNFVFTLVALVIIDKVGRRRIAYTTLPIMTAALVVASVAFHYLTLPTGGVLPDDGAGTNKTYAPVILAAIIVYVAAYATGIGNLPWQQAEMFEMQIRGLAVSLSTACNWAANLAIGSTFLTIIQRITASGAFGLYAGLCALGALFCACLYPETSGLSLEETKIVFEGGFGIKKAGKMRKAKKRALDELRKTLDEQRQQEHL